MRFPTLIPFLFAIIVALAAPLEPRLLGLNVTLPSQDPFYQPPAGFESAAPGSILNYRQVPVPTVFVALAPGVVESVWQVLFRSTDDVGNATAVVTTIFVPVQGDATKLFTQSIAYDASDVDCSPSYMLRTLTYADPDVAAIALALNSGWYVQTADFESYSAAFTNGIISGQSTLDSLRAGLQSGSFTNILPSARVALNGASGGALAIEWALELQPTYAPELSISGVTLGSMTPNIADVMRIVDGSANAELIPAAITGLAKVSSDMRTFLADNFKTQALADDFYTANTRCLSDNQVHFAQHNISSYFKSYDWLESSFMTSFVQRIGIMGLHGIPQSPVYVYKGVEDEISPIEDTDDLVEKWCHSNAPSVVYVRNIVTGHEGESLLGFVGAYEFIQERLNGVPPIAGCTIINSTKSTFNNSDATALGVLGPKVINILKQAMPTVLSD